MSTLSIVSGENKFELTGRSIIELELKLNQTSYGHEWSHLGDHLFNFYNLQGFQGQPSDILEVSQFQYQYLQSLNNRREQPVGDESSQPPQ